MNRIGKIYDRSAVWQADQVPLWREAEDVVLLHLQLGVFEEFFWSARLI